MTDTVAAVRRDLTLETTNRQQTDVALNARVDVLRTDLDTLTSRVTQLENSNALVAALDRVVEAVKNISITVGTGSETGTGDGTPTPTPTPAPTSYKVLTMADVTFPVVVGIYPDTLAGEINLGVGGHSVSFIAGNLYGTPIEFDVYITDEVGRHKVGSRLHITGWGWGSANTFQRVTLNGDWGNQVTKLEIAAAGIGYPDYTAFENAAYDGLAMWNGEVTYVGLGAGGANQTVVFTNIALTPEGNPLPPPPVAANPTSFTATIDGVSVTGTFAELCHKLTPGCHARLPDNTTIVGTGAVTVPCTIEGGPGTVLTCEGLNIAYGKATVVVDVPGQAVTLKGFRITGRGLNDDGGAAGVRDNTNGQGYILINMEIDNRPQGAASFQSDVTIEDSYLHENGQGGSGQGHNIYVQRSDPFDPALPPRTLIVRRTKSDKPKGGHPLKSRAEVTIVEDSQFTNDGNASVADFPNGGTVTMTNCSLTPTQGAGNKVAVTYGLEGMVNQGTSLTLNNVLIDDTQLGEGSYLGGPANSTLNLIGSTYKGVTPILQGFTVNGVLTAS